MKPKLSEFSPIKNENYYGGTPHNLIQNLDVGLTYTYTYTFKSQFALLRDRLSS